MSELILTQGKEVLRNIHIRRWEKRPLNNAQKEEQWQKN